MSWGDRIRMVAIMLAAISHIACGEDGRRTPPNPRPTRSSTPQVREPTYEATELTEWGTIGGNVSWIGDAEEPVTFEVAVHAETCGPTQPSRALRVSARNGVADVVVSIDIARGRALEPPSEPPVVDNVGCRFEPHVLAAGAGHPITFRSSDEVLHNVHVLLRDDTVLDLGLPERGAEQSRTIEAPGVYRLVCDAGHGWQQAWVHLFEHPYFAVTDQEGHFRIENVPPGQYRVRAWHEGWRVLGRQAGRPRFSNPVVLTRSVSVSIQQETSVDFELSTQSAEIAGG